MTRRLRDTPHRLLTLLVPRACRETVCDEIDTEARDLGRGDAWAAMQAARAGLSLRRASIVETVATDTRHALRSLVRARWFTVGAVLTFAPRPSSSAALRSWASCSPRSACSRWPRSTSRCAGTN